MTTYRYFIGLEFQTCTGALSFTNVEVVRRRRITGLADIADLGEYLRNSGSIPQLRDAQHITILSFSLFAEPTA